jgi:hypothetical protein
VQASPASGSLAGRPVALASSGEALELPFVHAGQPILAERGRWADPRVAGNTGVTQGMHVRPILVDPCAYLISVAPLAGPSPGRSSSGSTGNAGLLAGRYQLETMTR